MVAMAGFSSNLTDLRLSSGFLNTPELSMTAILSLSELWMVINTMAPITPANNKGVRKVDRIKVFFFTRVRYSRLVMSQVLFIKAGWFGGLTTGDGTVWLGGLKLPCRGRIAYQAYKYIVQGGHYFMKLFYERALFDK